MSLVKVFEAVTEEDLGEVARFLRSELLEPVATPLRPFSVALIGDLGAGKTSFVRSLLGEYGVTSGVASPTYVLCHEYRIDPERVIEHWDLYRLQGLPEELLDPPPRQVGRVVEWADKFPDYLRQMDCHITFELVPGLPDHRRIALYRCVR